MTYSYISDNLKITAVDGLIILGLSSVMIRSVKPFFVGKAMDKKKELRYAELLNLVYMIYILKYS